MNRKTADEWCERGIFGLFLILLVYGPLATGATRTVDFLVLQALTMGVMLLWILRLWLNPRSQLLWTPICWAVIAFTVYAIARYLTADIEYVARKEMVHIVVYAFLFFAVLNNLHKQEYTRLIVLTLVFLGMAISFYALYQFLTDSDKVWMFVKHQYKHRGSGTFISPNNLAGFLEMVLPLGLAWMLISRAKPVMKVFVGYASLAILVGIAVTVSRGAWVSVCVSLAIFFILLLRNRVYRLPAAILLVVIVGAGFYFLPRTEFFQHRLKQLTANGQIEDDARFDLWKPAVILWKQNIWWGIGPNHYNYRFREFRPQVVQRQPDRVHNDYLNTLTDYGVVGAALVLAAWVLLVVGIVKTWGFVRSSPSDLGGRSSNKYALLLGASIGLLAILIHSVVDFNMHVPANAVVVITLMALLTSCLRFATESYWKTVRWWVKVPISLVLLAGLFYLGLEGKRSAAEQLWLRRADRAPNASSEQIAALKKAFEIEPNNSETAYSIGEDLWTQSLTGTGAYAAKAEEAMDWFKRGSRLDPYNGYDYLGCGLCLDWLGKRSESWPYYDKAIKLDPNGYYTTAWVGWHYVQTGDYAAARTWFERSRRLQFEGNKIAESYLKIVNRRMLEQATNSATDKLENLLP